MEEVPRWWWWETRVAKVRHYCKRIKKKLKKKKVMGVCKESKVVGVEYSVFQL